MWVGPHLSVMRRVAVREVGSADADDVVQESLIRAWRRRETFDPQRGTVRTWLLAIVLDRAGRSRRQFARRRINELTDEPTGTERGRVTDADGRRLDIEAAVRRLAPRQRQVVVLHYLADLSVDDVGVVLGISSGSVKTHLRLARTRLIAELEAL